jgi:hypothetical protein
MVAAVAAENNNANTNSSTNAPIVLHEQNDHHHPPAVVPPPLPPNIAAESSTRTPLAFEPSPANQQSVGSTMVSYALAGFGVTLGFVLVRVLFGG